MKDLGSEQLPTNTDKNPWDEPTADGCSPADKVTSWGNGDGKIYVSGQCMICGVELHEHRGHKMDGQKRWNFGIRGMNCSATMCQKCYTEYRCATPQCRVKELIDALLLKGHQQRESDSMQRTARGE